jgi:dipeptidyl aminopeptidase/acylaminoacyl peptidase
LAIAEPAALGGNDALDVIYAARWSSQRLHIPEHRVGAYGMSHGGFATLCLLTFPGEANGRQAEFGWGFGIAEAAVTSIRTGYETSNIKGWYVKEAGDPAKPEVSRMWDERLPVKNLKNLRGRVLLIHGTNDERARFSESEAFLKAAGAAGKQGYVRHVPVQGAGHGVGGSPTALQLGERVSRSWRACPSNMASKVAR